MKILSRMVVAGAAALLLAGCTSYGASTTNTETTTPSTTVSPFSSSVVVTVSEYSITPNITLKVGQASEIVVKNTGKLAHTYTSSDLNINENIPAGQSKTIKVTPAKTGTFEVHCSVSGHSDLGMKSTIIVE